MCSILHKRYTQIHLHIIHTIFIIKAISFKTSHFLKREIDHHRPKVDLSITISEYEQAVPINGDNIPPLWSVPTPSRNTQQIVLFLSHCGSYTGENHSRKICLRRISAWLCPLECHGMEGIEAAFDTKSLGNVKKVFAKSCGNPIFGQFLATRGPKMRARTRKSIGVQRLTP